MECKKLTEHLQSLPFDLPKITGMTWLQSDDPVTKGILKAKRIEYVPTLYIEYYSGHKQILTGIKDVMEWLDTVKHEIARYSLMSSPPSAATATDSMIQIGKTSIGDDDIEIKSTSKNIMSVAMEIQKSREQDLKNK